MLSASFTTSSNSDCHSSCVFMRNDYLAAGIVRVEGGRCVRKNGIISAENPKINFFGS